MDASNPLDHGITSAKAGELLAQFGPNDVAPSRQRPALVDFLILLVAGTIAAADAIIIVTISSALTTGCFSARP